MNKKRSIIPLFFFIMTGLFWNFNLYAQDTGILKGRIVTVKGYPIDRVDIQMNPTDMGTSSNTEGYFFIGNIPAGEYEVEASTIGFESATQKVEIGAGETVTRDFVLQESAMLLQTITLKGGALKHRNRTTTVNTISLSDIKKLNISTPQDLLYEVPGVERTDLGQGGAVSQIGIRGFELGGHGGDLAMEVDGVSFNETEHSGGYVDMNILIPLNLAKMEVYKGPSSPLFGLFARGGAISFVTRKGGDYQDLVLKGGSYDAVDAQYAFGKAFDVNSGKLKTNFAAQINRSAGYMENSDYLKGNINGRLAYDLSENTEIGITLNGHSSRWDAPGFVTADMLKDKKKRRQQAINGENDGGDQVFASERLELNHSFNEDLKMLVYAYSIQQSQTRFSKFGLEPGPGQQTEVNHSRKTYAFGGSLNGDHQLGNTDIDWVGGFEFYNEFTDRTGWSAFNRVRDPEDPYQENTYRVRAVSLFGQGELDLSPYFRPSIGFRYESFGGTLRNHLANQKNDMQGLDHFSPKLGVRSTLADGFDVRASVSNGFSLPSGDLKYQSDNSIKPEKLWQYEIGASYDYLNLLHLDVSAYLMNNSQERTFVHGTDDLYINSGKTERRGVEFSFNINPLDRLNIRGAFTWQDTEIKDLPDSPELVGNQLTNLPKTITNLSVDYTTQQGIGIFARIRDAGKYPTNRINTDYYKGYTVVDAKLFYNLDKKYANKGRIFLEVNNVFNENYATYALDFWNEFGIDGGVFYAPAPMRNFSIGISYNLF